MPVWALSAHLRHFYGIVAVGTNGGIVYLIGNNLIYVIFQIVVLKKYK